MRSLARADLDRFFLALAARIPCRVRLILTGGGEALVLGGSRPTRDLDFGAVVEESSRWPEVEQAIAAAAAEAGFPVQYSEDIDRWSAIAIPRKRFRSRPFRRVGRLSVHLLDPRCWAVYKLARYLDSDAEDLIAVLRTCRVSAMALARLCGESLRTSPRSPALFSFRAQVEHFFRDHGRNVWGKRFDPERAVIVFHQTAAIGK